MKKGTLFISILTLALLQACGGDGGDSGSASSPTGGGGGTTPPASGDQGSVSAPFVVNAQGRFMVFATSAASMGPLTSVQQTDSGAVVSLSGYNTVSLSGNTLIKDIAGDASYAIGRWVQGTATIPSVGPVELTGADSPSYHYAVYNVPASFPATGSYTCVLQSATTPTLLVGGRGPETGSVSSQGVGLRFDSAGANLSGSLTITAGGESVTADMPTPMPNPTSLVASGQYYNGSGNLPQVTDAGNGSYGLMVGYAAQMASGAPYQGVAYMSCTAN